MKRRCQVGPFVPTLEEKIDAQGQKEMTVSIKQGISGFSRIELTKPCPVLKKQDGAAPG